MAKGFSIIADIEAKATLAAITDQKRTEIIVNGTARDTPSLLTSIVSSVSELVTDVSDSDSKEEKLDKSAKFIADFVRAYGAFVVEKYSDEEDDE